jgi:hypothetical protein
MVLSLFGAGLAKDFGNDVSGARNSLRRAMRRTPLILDAILNNGCA